MERDEINAAVEQRMGEGAFTFRQLTRVVDDPKTYRIADRAIQRWRKKGLISFARAGSLTIWSLTDEGRDFVKGTTP